MNTPSSNDRFELLLEDVLQEIANPAPSADLAHRTTQRSFAMPVELAAASNVLSFNTLDRTDGRALSSRSVSVAVLLNLAAMLLLAVSVRSPQILSQRHQAIETLEALVPPPAPPAPHTAGGGGGQTGATPVSKGNPPMAAVEVLNPPKAPAEAKVKLDATIQVDPNLKMAHNDLPNIGLANSPVVGTSLGNGAGNGIGSGNGGGIGPGNGGNMGGGLHRVGGGVSAPVVLFAPEPQFSDEARKAKVSGNVLVYLQVDEKGRPTHIRVLRGIGMGLDEKAIEAVSQYRFKPAMEDGRPVAIEMNVDVTFNIF